LRDAFNDLVSSPGSQRGLIAGIRKEELVPIDSIPSSSGDFFNDLPGLATRLKDNEAAYIILRRYENSADGYVAVTYVPDTANVRQKMLFASTRLTLVRELGTERFRETIFVTTKQELMAAGWQSHDKHTQLKAPLTEEEKTLQQVKDAEAEASMGTSHRASHLSSNSKLTVAEGALKALRELPTADDNLVQLVFMLDYLIIIVHRLTDMQMFDVPTETLELVGTSSVSTEGLSAALSDSEPRYSFFRLSHIPEGQTQSPIIFIYTCPPSSKIKARMLYAASRRGVVDVATKDGGLTVAKQVGECFDPGQVMKLTILCTA
jgi:twinfilin-like protein